LRYKCLGILIPDYKIISRRSN